MKKISLLMGVFLFIGTATFAKDAWFLNAEFAATDSHVLGIKAQDIDPSFVKVTAFTRNLVVSKYPEAKGDLPKDDSKFTVDLKKENKSYRVIVGAYEGQGVKGSFLLVGEKAGSEWKKVFAKTYPGKTNFRALTDRGDVVLVSECIDCGHAERLVWHKGRGYALE